MQNSDSNSRHQLHVPRLHLALHRHLILTSNVYRKLKENGGNPHVYGTMEAHHEKVEEACNLLNPLVPGTDTIVRKLDATIDDKHFLPQRPSMRPVMQNLRHVLQQVRNTDAEEATQPQLFENLGEIRRMLTNDLTLMEYQMQAVG